MATRFTGSALERSPEVFLNAAVLESLVDEISPRAIGKRVTSIRVPSRNCLELGLSGPEPLFVGVVADRALLLLFASTNEFPSCGERPADASARMDELKGATISSFEAIPGTSVALLRAARTDRVGRELERTLVIDFGKRPGLSLRDAGFVPRGAEDATPRESAHDIAEGAHRRRASSPPALPNSPSLAWRRDAFGRLHVGFPPTDRPWEESLRFETWNDAALHAACELLPGLVTERRRSAVARTIRRASARKRRALEKVRLELAESTRAEEHRHKAQLLLARKSDIKRGVSPVTVLDYDNVTEVEVDVDPLLPPTRNAEILFGRARKAERKALRAPARMSEIEDELAELARDLDSLDDASPELLSELEEKVHPPRAARVTGRKGERARFRTYEVSGGWKVLVGKSNLDNDVLTHKIARPGDLWFHARQSAGSHVILRSAGTSAEPGPDAIMEAAAIAAYHSKAGRAGTVPVCYTERRYVRKPRGARPGLAVVSNEKVVFVDPGLPPTTRPPKKEGRR